MCGFDDSGVVFTEHREPEAWYSWNQDFTVPAGCWYKQDHDREYRFANGDVTVSLSVAGDWLQIVDPRDMTGVRHVIV